MSEMKLPDSLNLPFVEGLYAEYLRNPASVPEGWQRYFHEWDNGERPRLQLGPTFPSRSLFDPPIGRAPRSTKLVERAVGLQDRVDQLIRAYRTRGHMIAEIDPLGMPRPCPPELEPSFYGLAEDVLDRRFSCETIHPAGPLTLREIIERLRHTYCRSIGVEYMHIDDLSLRRWLQRRMEPVENRTELRRDEQIRILTRLTDAVTFEEFIRKKFVGAKSFSLEGSESLIPLLDLAIEKAGAQGVRQIVMGMAHRGRLNVLANILGKSARQIFREFADADPHLYIGKGDVKYHLGHRGEWTISDGRKVYLFMCFNPSHLEFVNPVALGRMRAKLDRAGDLKHDRGLTILIHGDAAFPGQGVVQETLNLSQLSGYSVGGALHVIVNNQIGFTTSSNEARSSTYATDVAKILQIPIFHVNGEDPEAVAQVVRLALDFRFEFKRDVVIDMYGYRRLGHNESDEPSFTQPVLYRAIEQRKPVREGYLDHLLQLHEVTREEADEIAARRRAYLEEELTEARSGSYQPPKKDLEGIWKGFHGGPEAQAVEVPTHVERSRLAALLERQTQLPAEFHPHPKLIKLLETHRAMAKGDPPLDWSAAESLAYATLATQGARVRLSGQDMGRGTFSHRHAILHDYEDGRTYVPLQNLDSNQAPVEIYNSPLSEVGVLGFEYGYSLDYPDALTVWEAQFGDFCNVAQVIIDQFIASAEDKWHRLSGLVLFLPHGFEGQGPEHSSARLERFLQLAAEDNIQIANPTTPAQVFHLLRRQLLRKWRKPLIVMTPKSLLRHPRVVSTLEELASGQFERVLPDLPGREAESVGLILLCSGKIYYELERDRAELKRGDAAILRVEQLYPMPRESLQKLLAQYPEGTPIRWVQEEPENMGAWRYIYRCFGHEIGRHPLGHVCRPDSAAPATGSHNSHKIEQEKLLHEAFKLGKK
ncbi:MAG: 2-oxoglutarate dehydrogenase E1 component [Verrucomicrobiales bacterium]|nr:2-oxoglutarate dehydrogenase E1 component [Verrucomicrobiales bacterium]